MGQISSQSAATIGTKNLALSLPIRLPWWQVLVVEGQYSLSPYAISSRGWDTLVDTLG